MQDFLPDLADFDAAYAQKFEAGRFTLPVPALALPGGHLVTGPA